MRSRCPSLAAIALSVLAVGCVRELGPQGIVGNAPVQRVLAGPIAVIRHPVPDSAFLIVTIPLADSAAHVSWQPTQVRLSSSAGYENDFLAVPFACLRPRGGSSFPYNFLWVSCNQVQVTTSGALTPGEIAALESDLSGRVHWTRPMVSQPGATYLLIVPTGQQSTEEAARRASAHARVTSAVVPSNDPRCVRSDEFPRPPCPPWVLQLQVPFVSGTGTKDSVPVQPGGWVRATYTDANGATHSAELRFPPS